VFNRNLDLKYTIAFISDELLLVLWWTYL